MSEGEKGGSIGSGLEQYFAIFLGRDLSYIFSGALLISFAAYLWNGEILLSNLTTTLEIGGFIFGAYFIGFLIMELGFLCRIMRRGEKKLEQYEEEFYYYIQSGKIFSCSFFREQEREITLMVMRGSMGMAMLSAAVLLAIKTVIMSMCVFHGVCSLLIVPYGVTFVVLGIVGWYLVKENEKAAHRGVLKNQAIKNIVDKARKKKYKELFPF